MPGFTELPSEPDVQVSKCPALQFPLSFLAKHCGQYIRVLHYVLLLYRSQLENLLAFALWTALPPSLVRRHAHDYYASSVA